MKKFVWILGIIIAVGISAAFIYNQNKISLPKPIEQGFKNPLFYRPLEAYGRTSWHTFLTPTSITKTPPFDEAKKTSDVRAESYFCDLIENEDDHIKYDCYVCAEFITYQPCHRECIIYELEYDNEFKNKYWTTERECDTGNRETLFIKSH